MHRNCSCHLKFEFYKCMFAHFNSFAIYNHYIFFIIFEINRLYLFKLDSLKKFIKKFIQNGN